MNLVHVTTTQFHFFSVVAQSDFPWRPLVIRENCIPIWCVDCRKLPAVDATFTLTADALCFKFHYSSAHRLLEFADMLGSSMHTTGNCSYLLAMKTMTFLLQHLFELNSYLQQQLTNQSWNTGSAIDL